MNATRSLLITFDLIEKYTMNGSLKEFEVKFEKYKEKIPGFSEVNEEYNLKVGDTIAFIGGYDKDVEFISRILGFDSDGDVYVLWDCYWVALKLADRFVTKI